MNKLKSGLPVKAYNMSEAADLLGVHRHTIRYWMKQGWIQVKRDYRNKPAFTPEDLKKLEKWRRTLRVRE